MARLKLAAAGLLVAVGAFLALTNVSAHENQRFRRVGGWREWGVRTKDVRAAARAYGFTPAPAQSPGLGPGHDAAALTEGKRLFQEETFGGNGRTCGTWHSKQDGTVSPADAQAGFKSQPSDPLFIHDGTDDGQGHGVSRILEHATILMTIPIGHGNIEIPGPDNGT